MPRLTQPDLADLNRRLESRTPQELIRWARDVFGNRLGCLSAMQQAGTVVCHMISALKFDLPVLFVDTGVHFQETLDTRDRVAKDYGLRVVSLAPELSMSEQTERYGVLYLTPDGQRQCCDMRKTQPLLSARGQYDALIGSLRRSDGGKRSIAPIVAIDAQMNCVRVNPLVNFTDDQLNAYIAEHQVFTNPLHSQGFTTIGCNRCTTPVLPGEPKRSGRWRHLGPWAAYCGINPTDLDPDKPPAVDLPQKVLERLLGREQDFVI
jgi:phosphoadenosine phosphosulfate reductase